MMNTTEYLKIRLLNTNKILDLLSERLVFLKQEAHITNKINGHHLLELIQKTLTDYGHRLDSQELANIIYDELCKS